MDNKQGQKHAIHKVTSNRDVKLNKETIYKSNKDIGIHVEKYLFEIKKGYIKPEIIKICKKCEKCI